MNRNEDHMETPELGTVIDAILADYESPRAINKIDINKQPDKRAILEIIEKLMKLLFPGYYGDRVYRAYSLRNSMAATIEDVVYRLKKQIALVLSYSGQGNKDEDTEERAGRLTLEFMRRIPELREILETDVTAAYEGDPAAADRDEIIYCYPGLYAIAVYRMAHALTELGVPMIPRVMTEHAHSVTGIDIHPGAQIGRYFFIDHGTGIVIGETTVIGDHVKIYQGVTLGGLSTHEGQLLHGKKRHPTIGNGVTIYSGATILGGETVIGDNVTVGGNTFLVNSVETGTHVSPQKQALRYRSAE